MYQLPAPLDDEHATQHRPTRQGMSDGEAREAQARNLARGLGWFSLALGITELIAPQFVARFTGVRGNAAVIRAAGFREIATGIGLLSAHRQRPWIWARVAGDALDAATLRKAAQVTRRPAPVRMAAAFAQIAAITALDIYTARSLSAGMNHLPAPSIRRAPMRDYSTRIGFSQSPEQMRGAALKDFKTPRDMMTPTALQSYLREPAGWP